MEADNGRSSSGESDVIELGSSGGGRPWRDRRVLWLLVAAACLVAAAVGFWQTRLDGGPTAQEKAATGPTPIPSSSSPAGSDPTPTPAESGSADSKQPVASTAEGLGVLRAEPGWELFARGDGVVLRVQPHRGRVIRTPVPGLQSTGPVSFIVGRDRAIIRPLDQVPGYVVPDGQPARRLPEWLVGGGQVLPGPKPGQVWMGADDHSASLRLLNLADGSRTGVSSTPPPTLDRLPRPDGRGNILLDGVGGAYVAGGDGLHRITTGRVVAVGPTRWLVLECDAQAQCRHVVIDRDSGDRHALPRLPVRGEASGVISPDGSTAALLARPPSGETTLRLVDLSSGEDRALDGIPVVPGYGSSAGRPLAYSPGGDWLFAATTTDKLLAVDTDTGQVHDPGLSLPGSAQLAVRNPSR